MPSYKIRIFAALFSVVLATFLFTPPSQASTADAVNYLVAQQNTSGGYVGQNAVSTEFQSTSEAVRALNFVGESGQPGIPDARILLNASTQRNTEYLSRLLVLAAQAGENTQSLSAQLLSHQNNDGGFGDYPGFDSTVLDTAFALEAIAESTTQSAGAAAAVGFLVETQAASGGWSLGSNEPSVYLSAIAMRALWHYRTAFNGVGNALINAQNYLLSSRIASTGLWPETHESALALIAIVPNVSEFSQVESILRDFRDAQLSDGSWGSDTYLTALALRALASQPTPLPPVVSTGKVSGKVLNGVTRQPIATASVSIDSISAEATTDSAGVFQLEGLDPAGYSLRVSAPGYSQVGLNDVSVAVGVNTDLGDLLLSPLPSTGVLQGVITDAANSEPLAGVDVVVSGSSTAATATTADGRYSIVGLDPGNIVVAVLKDGYLPQSATATVVAGGTLVLNPALTGTGSNEEPLPNTPTTGALRGVVTDSSTGLPLQSAYIRTTNADGGASGAYSGADGSYQIVNLPPGNTSVRISRSGYLTITATGTSHAGNTLVFSPGLVPEGGDPDSATGEGISSEPQAGTPANGVLQGIATDLETGLPLPGVAINVTGSVTASTSTAADGSYSIPDMSPGNVMVAASLTGYLNVVADGSIVAGNATVFNPQLSPEGFVSTEPGAIVGRVIGAVSKNPLRFVTIRVTGGAVDTSGSTAPDGTFELTGLEPGDYTVSVERRGYVTRTFNAVVTSASSVDFQDIELRLALSEVTVFGKLTASDTGLPIANAVVSISGSLASAQTDALGNYRMDGLEVGSKTVIFSATGFNSQTLIYNFPEGGEFELNASLGLTANTGVDISFLGADQTNYAAYSPVVLQASVTNNGNPIQAMVVFSLFDQAGNLISEYMGTQPGVGNVLVDFPTSAITAVEANFNTANLPPGNYRLVGRVVVGSQMVGPATIILDERATELTIDTTTRISELKVDPLPKVSGVGATETINLLATLLNRSNVSASTFFRYQLLDPNGSVLTSSGLINIPLPVENDTVSITLDEFAQTFSTAGTHTLRLFYSGGVRPDNMVGGDINVAPGLRIEPSQSIAPGTVTPDEDQRVRITIRLEGREVQ